MGLVAVQPSFLRGEITVPPSKSQTLRALVFGLLAKGKSRIRGYLPSPDTEAMIAGCRLFGASIQQTSDTLEIQTQQLKTPCDVIDVGNSGQVLRFLGAVAGLVPGYTVFTGDASIRGNRFSQSLLDGLQQLGAFATSSRGDGYAPLIVGGVLRGGEAVIDGADSQPVSALLIVAPFISHQTKIVVTNPGEIPWVRLTLSWLDRFGIRYHNEQFQAYSIKGQTWIDSFEYGVPGDWSSASYPIAAALVTDSTLMVSGLDFADFQGDKNLIPTLQKMGAKFELYPESGKLVVLSGSRLKGIEIEVGEFIDAITLLSVIACFAEGRTKIVGGQIARRKESDRIASIVRELKKMGGKIEEHDDGMTIEGTSLHGAYTETYQDHRMAMSLIVAALGARGVTHVSNVGPIVKSYPYFIEAFRAVGARIQ